MAKPAQNPNLTRSPHQDRSKRVKDAKSEAQKEIEDYRKSKEEEFRKYEKEVSLLHPFSPAKSIVIYKNLCLLYLYPRVRDTLMRGTEKQNAGQKQAEDEANAETQTQLKTIKEVGDRHGDKVVQDLLRAVTDVQPNVGEGM